MAKYEFNPDHIVLREVLRAISKHLDGTNMIFSPNTASLKSLGCDDRIIEEHLDYIIEKNFARGKRRQGFVYVKALTSRGKSLL